MKFDCSHLYSTSIVLYSSIKHRTMAGWGGFSEEDLNRLKKDHFKSGTEFIEDFPDEKPENIRKANISTGPKRQKPREKIKTKNTTTKINQPNGRQSQTVQNTTCKSATETFESKSTQEVPTSQDKSTEINTTGTENASSMEEEKVPELITETDRIKEIELTALQKMQQKQKEMEDQNKKKKAALQETIRTRFKKTQAEANTLKYVHKELAHLDNLLSADVAVLRDTIEEATRDYHHALKKYDQAESEFVAAKLDLHQKTERKEMLTEHLLAIIQQNEERKARKLEELMAKLDVSEEVLDESSSQIDHNRNTGNENETNGNKMEEGNMETEKKIRIVENLNQVNGNDGKISEKDLNAGEISFTDVIKEEEKLSNQVAGDIIKPVSSNGSAD